MMDRGSSLPVGHMGPQDPQGHAQEVLTASRPAWAQGAWAGAAGTAGDPGADSALGGRIT